MKYDIVTDIKTVMTLLRLTSSQLAENLGVARSTVSRILKGQTYPNDLFLESFYSFSYDNPIRPLRLNQIKIQFGRDNYDKLLFHGARGPLEMPIDLDHSRSDIDLGKGFYLGESFEQASSYVFSNLKSSIYLFAEHQLDGLRVKEFGVSLEWMLLVAYYRGHLGEYEQSAFLQSLLKDVAQYDVIVAPIVDNNMYEIITQFARGDLTDQQAKLALSASNLGKQHVLKSEKACQRVAPFAQLYLCEKERHDISEKRKEARDASADKARLAIQSLRRKGKYIEEILK